MKRTALPMTDRALSPNLTHMRWDSDLLYASMRQWSPERFVPSEGVAPLRHVLGTSARALSKSLDLLPAWRRSSPRRWLRDVGQIQRIRVTADTEVLYGHIVFPISRPPRPTVWSTNGVIDARPGLWFPDQSARTHERLIARAAAVQCWTEFGKAGLLERAPKLAAEAIAVIPPLVLLQSAEPFPRTSMDPVAVFIGANGVLKGIDIVVAAAARARDVRFEIITRTPPPVSLPGNVDWLGPRPHREVLARLASSSIHVFPSTTESLGGVVVEALAAGVPQIVDRNGVTAEVLGEGGLAVDGTDDEAVAHAVEVLAADDALRAAFGAAGRARYLSCYSPDVVGPRLERLIDSL